jgi:phosphatidylinositol glycan class W
MLYTCLCILAVDFNAFPRRYAKAEAYGSGLMDVGVGGIILASGLVSPSPRALRSGAVAGTGGAGGGGLAARLSAGLRAALPCLLLGGARLAAVKLLGYQEVVGEYGAHWNFFATIACVVVLSHAVPVPPGRLAAAAAAVTLAHQALLSAGEGKGC